MSVCVSVLPCVCVWTSVINSHMQALLPTINAVRDFFLGEQLFILLYILFNFHLSSFQCCGGGEGW